MQVQSHLYMANYIQNMIEINMPVKLCRSSFLFGNILPDLRKDKFMDKSGTETKIEHFPNSSIDFIRNQIYSLYENTLSENALNIRTFSLQLGKLTHYFSDFFCHAHSQRFKGSLKQHYLYEAHLSHYLFRTALLETTPSPRLSQMQTIEDIINHFNSLQSEYLSYEPSFDLDIQYITNFCLTLCSSLISLLLIENSGVMLSFID